MSKLSAMVKKNLGAASPILRGGQARWEGEALLVRLFICLEGLLLPSAVILGGISPFGIAFLSCFYLQKLKLPIMLSTAAGYLLAMRWVDPLKYLLTICLVYMFSVAYERAGRVQEDLYLIPLATSLTLCGVGAIYAAMGGFLAVDMLHLISETLLCFLASVLFMGAVPAVKNLTYDRVLRRSSITAIFILFSVSLLPLVRWQVGALSVGRMLGVLLILGVVFSGSIPFATMCGTIFGIGLGLMNSNFLLLCTSYGVAALVGSLLAGRSRFWPILGFMITHGVVCIYGAPQSLAIPWMTEVLLASLVALFLPMKKLKYYIRQGKFSLANPLHENKVKELAALRLRDLAGGFREVYETVQFVSDRLRKVNFADPAIVYREAVDKACKGCSHCTECWNEGYETSMDGLMKLTPVLRKEGQVTLQQLRGVFPRVCIRPGELVRHINGSYSRFMVRRRISEEQAVSRKLECEQFVGLSGTIEQMAAEIDRQYRFDTEAEGRIASYLTANGVHPTGILVMYDGDNKARVEVELRTVTDFRISTQSFLDQVSMLVERPLANFDMQSHEDRYRIVLTEQENLHPNYYMMSNPKAGECASGDRAHVFKSDRGKLVMVVADGMGSGHRAAIDAGMAVKIVEKVMLGGFETKAAMNILNAAMTLSGGGERVTAVDTVVVDLFSGRCDFIKVGAAPTYVKKGGVLYRMDNKCIPAGILDSISPEHTTMTLWEHDYVVMVSDGVCDGDDSYLVDLLRRNDYESPQALCEGVMEACRAHCGGSLKDDCTVLAAQL